LNLCDYAEDVPRLPHTLKIKTETTLPNVKYSKNIEFRLDRKNTAMGVKINEQHKGYGTLDQMLFYIKEEAR
jgi:hypothetical protein